MDKNRLINKLMRKEQKTLKIRKRLQIRNEDKIEVKRIKTSSSADKRTKLINQQLLIERKNLFGDQHISLLPLTNTSETTDTQAMSEIIHTEVESSPCIQKDRLYRFLKKLSEEDKPTNCQKSLGICVSKMNSSVKGHWTLPITTMRAIKDCLLHRKWDNLTHLLLILIKLPSTRYQPLIRHVSNCHS